MDLSKGIDGSCHISQGARERPKQVRFDEDSEWIDISENDILDELVEAERWLSDGDEDEYILL